ncbi:MAG TPA: ABC transporter ATP-binding protein [Thermomonospora sp.]|nr:ABC transporter ATP-binding protein [Thermomonospora sp.]
MTSIAMPVPETGAGRWSALVELLRPHRGRLAVAIAAGLADQGLGLASALLGAVLVGRAFDGAEPADLVPGLVGLGLLVAPKVLAAWMESYVAHDLAYRVLAELRDRTYAQLARLTPGYLLRRRSGDVGAVALGDIETLELFFAHSLSPLVVALSVPAACLAAAAVLHPLLAVALLPAILAMATVPFWLRRRAADHGRRLREATGEAAAETVDSVQGLAEVVAFGRQDAQTGRLADATARLGDVLRGHRSRGGVEKAAGDLIAALGLLAVLLTAIALIRSGGLAADRLPVALVLAGFAFLPLMSLVDTWRELGGIAAAARRLTDILDARPDVDDRVTTPPSEAVEPSVTFDAVSFRYGPDLPDAVREVSFTVGAGRTVALAGHSGAGKSTCAALLLRWWDVTAGAVRIGGHDVRDLPGSFLRSLVGSVPQDTYLFALSVRDNIRLARPDATDEEVEAAARTACAHEFITRELPDAYDTLVGERGAQLSGGQRQRIAITRALLADPAILVLDEAVSNLDAESEAAVEQAMHAARTGRTTLVVAHRPSTLRAADEVVLLEDGRVVDVGPHDVLLGRCAAYRRLLAQDVPAS